jgi:hypothetical protein
MTDVDYRLQLDALLRGTIVCSEHFLFTYRRLAPFTFHRGVVSGFSVPSSLCNQTAAAFTGVSPSETSATFPDLCSFESSKSNVSATPFWSSC